MGDSEITAARNYAVGAAGRLTMDALPLSGACTTYSIQEVDPDTGTEVRIAALGPQAANVVGITDQTDLFRLMLRAIDTPPALRLRRAES